MLRKFVLCLLFGALFQVGATEEFSPWACVLGDAAMDSCLELSRAGASNGLRLNCRRGRDRVDCLKKIISGEADFATVDPEDMYVAAKLPGANFKIIKEIRDNKFINEDHRYEAVAVVHSDLAINNLNQLRGTNSCHTGVGRTVGYRVPVTKLSNLGVLESLTAEEDEYVMPRERELRAFSRAFHAACIVGEWVPDRAIDRKLKTRYRNLCSLCENPDICDYPDRLSGYEGALKCLVEGGGTVAWTKWHIARDFFGLGDEGKAPQADPAHFAYLCPDGTKHSMGASPCTWAGRPWPAIIANGNLNIAELQRVLRLATDVAGAEQAARRVLGTSEKSTAVDREPIAPAQFVVNARFNDVVERNVGRGNATLCLDNSLAALKCSELALAAFSRDVRPPLLCVERTSSRECMRAVQEQQADLTVLGAAETHYASRHHSLHAIVSENSTSSSAASRVLVAVVRKSTGLSTLQDVRGKPLCGHSAGAAALGWRGQIDQLLQGSSSQSAGCSLLDGVAHAFANSMLEPEELTSKSDTGAMSCLAESRGDVAFVSAAAALNSTGEGLQLLCGQGGVAPIDQFNTCHLVKLPPPAVVTSDSRSEAEVEAMRMMLLAISKMVTGKTKDAFKLFGPYEGESNLIFSDSAGNLELADPEDSVRQAFNSGMDRLVANNCSTNLPNTA